MTEHETCKGCQWNDYPLCTGTKIDDTFMKIDKMRPNFRCGQKEEREVKEHQLNPKSRLELLEERIKALEEVRK